MQSDELLLRNCIPVLQSLGTAMGYSIAITDHEKYIFYLPSGKLDLKINPGDPIPDNTAIRRSLDEGRTCSLRGDVNTFGIPYLVRSFPLRNALRNVIGGCAILQATETEDQLQKLSMDLAAAIQALTVSSDGMAAHIDEMRTCSDQLLTSMEGTCSAIQDSKRITDFVHKVSQQSDLLSINAVIEAARTGLRESAFHVVAKEMRNLAQNTKDSMEQINAVLAQIRASSEQNSAEVQALHTLVTQISDEIGNIFSTIRQVNETATTLQKISSSLI